MTEKTRVPLLYLHSCTLILKKPSFFALEKCELQKVSVETRDLDTLSELKKQEGLLKEEEPVKISKKKLIKWENKLKKRQLYREKRRKARFDSTATDHFFSNFDHFCPFEYALEFSQMEHYFLLQAIQDSSF